jgi:ADP-dependent phosphofructokinase/glucokinase
VRILKDLNLIEQVSVHCKGFKFAVLRLENSYAAQAGMPVLPKLAEAGADFDVFVGEAGQDGAAFGAD